MEREKELIERRVILPLAEQEEARRHGVVAASAVILFGPPGTGKTTFAKGIAGRLGWPFVEVFPSQLVGTDAHGRAGALRELFDQLLYLDRVVVFIDEVEEIASSRQERPETHVIANELLKLMPTFREAESRLLVCATNSIRELDHAFTRPGRFDYLLPVGPPDRSARDRDLAALRLADHGRGGRRRRARRALAVLLGRGHRVRRAQGRAGRVRALARRRLTRRRRPRTSWRRSPRCGPSISAAMAREFEEDIERFARFYAATRAQGQRVRGR